MLDTDTAIAFIQCYGAFFIMGYIIVWRNSHREPHIDVDSRNFKEEYMSFEDAKKAAEEILRTENENDKSPWYFDYQIYQECNS